MVEEDFLNFRFKIGDCVAGIEEDLNFLVGKIIIGVEKNGETMLCRLLGVSGTTCRIFLSKDKKDQAYELVKAAEVIWHRIFK
ncbi:MAG: hypothetical protein LBB29_01175 [Holosporaceae bacterium]|jgi:hypothetical protein|nr:hypothetical protein [Holosporaceae bacterium]